MSRCENLKKIEKLFFSDSSVQYPAEKGELKSANSLEWQLIKAALIDEIHWIDGFLIFETWRKNTQKGDYLELFRKIASHVKRQLEDIQINGFKMVHPTGRPDFWVLEGSSHLESNIQDALSIAREARNIICKGVMSDGVKRALQAYKTWPNAKTIIEALMFTPFLPPVFYEDRMFTSIKAKLVDWKKAIVAALAKVIVLGVENRQGLNPELIKIAFERWGDKLIFLNNILSRDISVKDIAKNRGTEIFISLYAKYKQHESISVECGENEHKLIEEERNQLILNIASCEFVKDAAEDVRNYFDSIDYLKIYQSRIDESLKLAVWNFINKYDVFEIRKDNLFLAFSEYLERYVKKNTIRAGISSILEAEDECDSKKKQIVTLLETILNTEGLSSLVNSFIKEYSINTGPRLILWMPAHKRDCCDKCNSFRFDYQTVRLFGRDGELQRLHRFATHKKGKLLWWMVTGKGGAGKSRLALHICLELKEADWHTGFIEDVKQLDNLLNWEPTKNTFIVVDYSYGKAKAIGNFLNSIYLQKDNWEFSVRILILDRDEKSEAVKQFCSSCRKICEEIRFNNLEEVNETPSLNLV